MSLPPYILGLASFLLLLLLRLRRAPAPSRGTAAWRRRPPPRQAAFTYTEIMTAMGLFSLVVIGVVYTQLFGMRLFNVTSTRVSASDNARKVLDRVRDEVRSGKMLYVGNGNSAQFTNITLNGLRQGNALQIYPTTATNVFIRYYMDTASQSLRRVVNGSTQSQVLALYLTNRIAFAAEDCTGHTLTNDQNNRVIKMMLDFYQWEFPVAQAGINAFYDSYHVQTRLTRRTIE
jgi:hypothetical protein